MAVEYPDIVSEYLDAETRYECGGVQIVPSLEPSILSLGGYALLILLVQNTMDAPVELLFQLDIPTIGTLRSSPVLEVAQGEVHASLEPAEVGSLFIPIKTTDDARQGEYKIRLGVQAKSLGPPERVRSSESAGRIDRDLLPDVVGLDLGRVLGVAYHEQSTSKFSVPVVVQGTAAEEGEQPSMAVKFESLWKKENMEFQHRAVLEVNSRRAEILKQMATEPLYVALYAEMRKRFKQANVSMHTGEAIGLGKILAYTVRSFMDNSQMQDGLLVPIWETAEEMGVSTMDPLQVLRSVGLGHVVRLSVAVSFSLIAQVYSEQPWSLEERRSLTEFISEKLDTGEPLPIEFLYIPLLAGAAIIWPQLVLEGEDASESLQLLQKAKAARVGVFADADLEQASQVFDRLLSTALEGLQ